MLVLPFRTTKKRKSNDVRRQVQRTPIQNKDHDITKKRRKSNRFHV